MAKAVLQVKDLTKRYGSENGGFLAVDQISFELKEGEILGFLGPNGAGKTTTIDMLLGLTIPTSGEVWYFGKNLATDREYITERINFASVYSQVQGRATVRQNLKIYGGLYRVENLKQRIEEVAGLLGIGELMERVYWHLSSGEKTRVNLAKALINSPKILLMDEPTASLDPEIGQRVIELVMALRQREGTSILYTSHNMAEVARICDRVMFLDRGKIVAEDTPLGLTKMIGKAKVIVTFDGDKTPVEKYLKRKGFGYKFLRKQMVEVVLNDREIPKALFGLSERGVWLTDIDIEKPDLVDVFLSIARGGKDAVA